MSTKFQVVDEYRQRTGRRTNESGNDCRVVRLDHELSSDKHESLPGKIEEAVADGATKEARRTSRGELKPNILRYVDVSPVQTKMCYIEK